MSLLSVVILPARTHTRHTRSRSSSFALMDSTASLLSPRYSAPSPLSPISSSSSPSPSSFSPLPSPRPLSSSAPLLPSAGFPDLDSSASSFWGSPKPFTTTPLQHPPPPRPRPPAISITNYAATTAAQPRACFQSASPRRTHYTLLGISPTSSPHEIRSAYRKLALQHHPDVSPLHQLDAATKLFAEINEAYTTLSDPQKKARYDLQLALESPRSLMAMSPTQGYSNPSPRKYTDASTGRVYPSINSFYREWRRGHSC